MWKRVVRVWKILIAMLVWGVLAAHPSGVLADTPQGPGTGRTLCYKVTSEMWGVEQRRGVATSQAMLERIHRAFRLWEGASAGTLRFEYAGFAGATYDSVSQVPYDGCIYVVLHGSYNFHGESGIGGYNGTIPELYKRGYIFLNKEAEAVTSGVIIHEIGHALGLPHAATSGSAVFSGRRAWGPGEPPALVEQDGADLRARWTPGASGLYAISGTIETTHEHSIVFVFAVDCRNGHTYSVRSDHMGRFSMALLRPGQYRLVAKAAETSQDLAPLKRQREIPQGPSWYIADGSSVAEPYQGTVLTLSDSQPAIREVRLRMIDKPPPFPLTRVSVLGHGYGELAFLKPGDEATLELTQAGEELASVESYGSRPDYLFLPVAKAGKGRYHVSLRIAPDAEAGERLVIARARDGRMSVGLVGIHIIKTPETAR